jgi:hypothetical protein
MAVHAMSLAFVAKKARSGGKLHADAGLLVAAEWLQVGVHEFATRTVRQGFVTHVIWHYLLVVALQRCWLVAASCLALFRAVIFSVLVGRLLVERVIASDLGAFFFELCLSSLGLREHVFVVIQRLRHGSRLGVIVLNSRS